MPPPGNDTTPQAPNNAAYCASPPQTGIDVRGSNNAPFGGMPTQATAPGGTGGGQPTQTGTQTQPGGAGLTGTPLGATTLATLLGIS